MLKQVNQVRYFWMRKSLFVLFLLSGSAPVFSQIGVGADIVSRYVWRGLELGGDSPALQPYVSLATNSGLEVGVWSSYNLVPNAASNELDWYVSYSISDFSITVTDYTFPGADPDFDYFDSNNHVLEVMLGYSGVVDVMAAINVLNDDQNSIYLQLGKSLEVGQSEVGVFAGLVPMQSDYYLTDGFAPINLGFSGSRELKISDDFGLGVSGTYIVNPEMKKGYFIFGIGI